MMTSMGPTETKLSPNTWWRMALRKSVSFFLDVTATLGPGPPLHSSTRHKCRSRLSESGSAIRFWASLDRNQQLGRLRRLSATTLLLTVRR